MNKYLSKDFLFTVPTDVRFTQYYLYLAVALIVAAIGLKIFFVIKKRPEYFRSFDKMWFWGYLVLGFLGLFVWFSRYQALPIFSTRVVSYAWLKIDVLFAVFLVWYFKLKMPEKVEKYYDKKRKAKYLK